MSHSRVSRSRICHAHAAAAVHHDGITALNEALHALGRSPAEPPDVVFLFASAEFGEIMPELVRRAWRETGARTLLGCSGTGIIGPHQEYERLPALALLTLSLPGAHLWPIHITQSMLEDRPSPATWHQRLGISPDDVSGWLLLADPFLIDSEALVEMLGEAYPHAPVTGGLASPGPLDRKTWVYLNGETFASGAIGLGIGGDYELVSLVSQGCEPIGEPWTITGVQDHWIESIANRPAAEVLIQTLQGLPADAHARARHNLLVGLAIDEYRQAFRRGDFLIRNVIGMDRATGALALGTPARLGQTVQFQLRDAATADLDLHLLLDDLRARLVGREPVAGLLFSCTGRGIGLFGTPHHDVQVIERKLGPVPLAGLFCAGEIGPVGGKPFVHGFTASLALIVPRTASTGAQPGE
ncbi:MAG: hypothetical protein KatS3mg059_0983 [Thermomicrobiales bacterium]|nr:MAG: hypothetical protein KatS3mg059_0983 [Thermomicrobiales bacterium]